MKTATIEDIVNYFKELASTCKLISHFSTGEVEDISEGQENYPHLFLEQPFAMTEVLSGSKGGYQVFSVVFKVLDRVEDKTQFVAITSKCMSIASYLVLKMQQDNFAPYAIENVVHLTDTETNDNYCTFDRVELELKFARYVSNCDLTTIFDA